MTEEFNRTEWKAVFAGLSHDLADWETKVQIMNDDSGVQILSAGLPFNGITFDNKNGRDAIELSIGCGPTNHQTHNIIEPRKVAFEASDRGPAGTLDIEDASGTKTLITFIQPMPVLVKYRTAEMIAIG